MEHSYIEKNALVDRYLNRRLGVEERAAFEEHFLDCRQCLDQLKFAEALQNGIRAFAADPVSLGEVPSRVSFWKWFAGAWWRIAVPVAAALLIVLLPVAVLVQRYRNKAAGAEIAAADMRANYAALQRQLDQAKRAATVFILSATRESGSETTQKIPIPPTPQWIVLAMEHDVSQFRSYRATLLEKAGRTIWQSDVIEPGSPDAIGISFPSSLLMPGDYSVRLEGIAPGGQTELVATMSFQAVRNP
jgi:hypothetical protein